MRNEIGEPTGMRVRNETGAEMTLEFAAFVAAIERGDIQPEDEVCSHIVTQDRWVRVGEMRLYRKIMHIEAEGKAEEQGEKEEEGEHEVRPYDVPFS